MKSKIIILLVVSGITITCVNRDGKIMDGKKLANDTQSKTKYGNMFTAPAGWSLYKNGDATIIEAPEKGSMIVLVDVRASNDSVALLKAWDAYKKAIPPLKMKSEQADIDGWSRKRNYVYLTSPDEKRTLVARVMFANDIWTVCIYDMKDAIGEKRGSQVELILNSLLPKGYTRESFAGKKPKKLDDKSINELTSFIENSIEVTGVPGVALGLIQDNKVVFSGGFGVRELGGNEKVDEHTLFLIASNTKALTTLLLAKLVDAGKITWTTPVTELMSGFRLGSDETTKRTLVEHLVCACTGLPRKDMEMLFEFGQASPESVFIELKNNEPTSDFGELFQYSNSMAAAAGYIAGHVEHPELELGKAYDLALQTEILDPLGMQATTFNFDKALSDNHASAHSINIYGETAIADMGLNNIVVYARPAGGAWSNVTDMLKYIQMEINEGMLPGGTKLIGSDALLERRIEKVPVREHETYGMGLMVNNTYGIPVVHHGGDLIGHHSDMIWLPEQGVGAVILTNGDPGWLIRSIFQRKLLEVIFDGKPEADSLIVKSGKQYFEGIKANRKLYTIPADPLLADGLASKYRNESLGNIDIIHYNGSTIFDFGEWKSQMASKVNPDNTVSFVTIDPGMDGFEFVVGTGQKRALILRDAQHEYTFVEK
jgi:CubicO group peptidase (beta-lactamase class C family)